MIENLPSTAEAIIRMEWADYEPRFKDLESHELSAFNVEQWLREWSALAACLDEQYARLYVGTTRNTADSAIENGFKHFVEVVQPQARAQEQKLKQKLLASGIQPAGFSMGLKKMRAEAAIFSEANLPLLAEEQNLGTDYNKIIGAQTVLWEGEERTMAQMYPLLLEKDRGVRERAWRLSTERRLQDRDAINNLWQKFMRVRLRIAANAGLEDYRAYVWQQKFRFDYSPDDCKMFHQAVERVVVPAAGRIYEGRKRRLGLEAIRPWDLEVDPSGAEPVRPYGTVDELKSKARAVFEQVDPRFGVYFQTMMEQDLLDLDSRKNKAPGAYDLGYSVANLPFIFMSATGTPEDVLTLLHEGGHAFHVFEAAGIPYFQERAEAYLPMEFGEVASMAMELLASPYLTLEHGGFYTEEQAAHARIKHLEDIVLWWPRMAQVDAFQHWIYENPQDGADPEKCSAKFAELWDRFMPEVDFGGLEGAQRALWHRILHIHVVPFYFIEYAFAQLGAVQVWANARRDQKQAVADYRKALSLGATVRLPELFETAGGRFAFDTETLREAVRLIEQVVGELEEKLK